MSAPKAAELRVAVIGSGPAGFYTADRLLKNRDVALRVDVFDRSPVPFGLVRSGVAPDHQRVKTVTEFYHRVASDPRFRFFGDVEFGTEIAREDLQRRYHQIVFACGAQADRALGIPGEYLSGVHSARQFVGWYNGSPDYSHLYFNFATPSAIVIGAGNVAADVARMLCRTREELAGTDVADNALEALTASEISQVVMAARRGPLQTRLSVKTVKELQHLSGADVVTVPDEMELDPLSRDAFEADRDAENARVYDLLRGFSQASPAGKGKRLLLRFLLSPVEILGDETGVARAVRFERNELYLDEQNGIQARGTGEFVEIEAGLVLRAVGFKGVSLPGLPFLEGQGVIPNEKGRIVDPHSRTPLRGLYVAGWIKRGPHGLIGASKGDANETADSMLEDARRGVVLSPTDLADDSIPKLLHSRKVEYVTYDDWLGLDALERARGKKSGRPRVKITKRRELYGELEKQWVEPR